MLHEAEDGVRNGLLARGTPGPDRTTVTNALGVSPPTDSAGTLAFGRSMGATHVLTGRVTPLTGQYNLELHLYDVARPGGWPRSSATLVTAKREQ